MLTFLGFNFSPNGVDDLESTAAAAEATVPRHPVGNINQLDLSKPPK